MLPFRVELTKETTVASKILKAQLQAIVVEYFDLRHKMRLFAHGVSEATGATVEPQDVMDFLEEIGVNEQPPANADKTWDAWDNV